MHRDLFSLLLFTLCFEPMKVLGISAFYHDSAAALVDGSRVLAAAQEERFTRVKHDASFPKEAIEFCLSSSGLNLKDLDAVVFYEKPFLKFERILETYLAFAPHGFSAFRKSFPLWITEKLFQKKTLTENLSNLCSFDPGSKLLFTEHHASHCASAYLPSPFEKAAIVTLDGVGEWATTVIAEGKGKQITPLKEIHFPHSLGLLYSALTYYLGFVVNSGEYKVMGLAPYGEPIYRDKFLDIIDVKEDGSFRLNQKFFDYCTGLKMVNKRFERHFGQPARTAESEIQKFHVDVAASLQAVTEEVVSKIVMFAYKQTGQKNLCLAGGVALNCVANGKLLATSPFENIWVQPAAGDAGGALGAALLASHDHESVSKHVGTADAMKGSFLGPEYGRDEILRQLESSGAMFEELQEDKLITKTASVLAHGKIVGWMNGKMEFGPRALGSRSILADPRSPDMQKNLNLKIKQRESFRPFAPAVLQEDQASYFELESESPYMLFVSQVRGEHLTKVSSDRSAFAGLGSISDVRSTVPAVTHIDNSARIQTVLPTTNPKFHTLLKKFKEITGLGMLINTSFNVRGEPIVATPEDAYRCFMNTELDYLVIGNFLLDKKKQPTPVFGETKRSFPLD